MREATVKTGARPRVENLTRTSHRQRVQLVLVGSYPDDVQIPRTRGDCLPGGCNEVRPCPFSRCRHHLAIDVQPSGNIKRNFPDVEIEDMRETCSLDVADRGEHTFEQISQFTNVVRERARQIEASAMKKFELRAGTRARRWLADFS